MNKLRLSDDQRRMLAVFIDNPPSDRLGLIAAIEYLTVVNVQMKVTLREGRVWEPKDIDLMATMSQALRDATSVFTADTVFWEKVQRQLLDLHPELKAR